MILIEKAHTVGEVGLSLVMRLHRSRMGGLDLEKYADQARRKLSVFLKRWTKRRRLRTASGKENGYQGRSSLMMQRYVATRLCALFVFSGIKHIAFLAGGIAVREGGAI